jgi:hypothetical protein
MKRFRVVRPSVNGRSVPQEIAATIADEIRPKLALFRLIHAA